MNWDEEIAELKLQIRLNMHPSGVGNQTIVGLWDRIIDLKIAQAFEKMGINPTTASKIC